MIEGDEMGELTDIINNIIYSLKIIEFFFILKVNCKKELSLNYAIWLDIISSPQLLKVTSFLAMQNMKQSSSFGVSGQGSSIIGFEDEPPDEDSQQ